MPSQLWRRVTRSALNCNDHGHLPVNKVGRQRRQSIKLTFRPTIFDRDVATLNIACFVEALPDWAELASISSRTAEQADHWQRRLLRTRRELPRRRAAEQRDEIAPLHSITWQPWPDLQDADIAITMADLECAFEYWDSYDPKVARLM